MSPISLSNRIFSGGDNSELEKLHDRTLYQKAVAIRMDPYEEMNSICFICMDPY